MIFNKSTIDFPELMAVYFAMLRDIGVSEAKPSAASVSFYFFEKEDTAMTTVPEIFEAWSLTAV